MKLNNVKVSLTEKGWNDSVKSYECKETEKTFSWPGTRIDKAKIMTIDSMWRNSHAYYHLETWCLDEDLLNAKKMLIDHIKEKAAAAKVVCDSIYAFTHLNPLS